MRLPTLFKQNKNRSYSYQPRYYNERKERLDKLQHTKTEKDTSGDYFERNAARSFREDWRRKKSKAEDANRRLRFFVIVIFLFLAFFAAVKVGALDFIK